MLRYLMAYPKKNFSYPGPSMRFSNRINWIISDVQAKKFFLIIFLASNRVLAMLGSWIGTCSVFFHSYSVSPGVNAVATNAILFHNGKMLYNHWFLFNNFVHILWPKRPWRISKSKPPKLCSFNKQKFSMRFRRKKFRHNSLIFFWSLCHFFITQNLI
jgi:hypothetical protein